MTIAKKSLVVPYTPAQMFDLVTATERYPEFLSWCKGTQIRSRTPAKIEASIQGTKLGVSFSVPFVYHLEPHKNIEIRFPYMGGPFRSLEGSWHFTTLQNKTELSFELRYEITNAFIGWTLTPLIKNEISNLLSDFNKVAKKRYG